MKPSSVMVLSCLCGASASTWVTSSTAARSLHLSRALVSVRGGDFGVRANALAGLFIAEGAIAGSLAVPDPTAGAEQYGLEIKQGSLEAWCIQTAGYSKINAAIFTFLSVFKNMSPELAIAYSVIPCSSAIVSNVLTDGYVKQGANKGVGALNAVVFLSCQYAIFSGSPYATLGAQILAGFHLIVGALGYFMPTTSAKMMGIDVEDEDGSRRMFYKNPFSLPLLSIGVAYTAVLSGASAVTALSCRALVDAGAFLGNIVFNEGEKMGVPNKTLGALLAFSSIIGVGTQFLSKE